VPLPEPEAAAAWLGAQGVKNAERWLAFAGGAPLRALEYATGERGEVIERVLRGIASGDRAAIGDVRTREELEPLGEVLHKMALDRAFSILAGRSKYGGGGVSGDARAWLAYARQTGRLRTLARHPLNPKLFAAELLAGMPEN
jgi:DNA polymerase-3 subunit delta'